MTEQEYIAMSVLVRVRKLTHDLGDLMSFLPAKDHQLLNGVGPGLYEVQDKYTDLVRVSVAENQKND